MAEWMPLLSTFLGGILAALAGLVVSAYDRRKQRERRLEEWHRSVYRTAVSLATPYTLAHADRGRREAELSRLESVAEILREKTAAAPPDVDVRILDSAENAIIYINQMQYHSSQYGDSGRDNPESHEEVQEKQKDLDEKREEIIYLTLGEFEDEYQKVAQPEKEEEILERLEEREKKYEKMREDIVGEPGTNVEFDREDSPDGDAR